ncbi:hypothetical protein CMO92_01310 [Candidatus Woesearchaeota archaeon]|nr:hypothetical protein [Candidatus Woesearchaeota archaeon]
MKIILKKTPKKPTIIEGFPGFGLVGTIATEFLIDHLKPELIGEFIYTELPATIAIHKNDLIRPMAVFYDKKHNIVILHTLLNTKGFEFEIANNIADMAKKMQAKEIISLEGVACNSPDEETKLFWYGNNKFGKLGAEPIQESIIVGVTAAVMLRYKDVSCLFATTHSALPDSSAAAKIIELLNKYLKLGVNTKPLQQQAEQFESKLKNMLQQTANTERELEKKNLSYVG